MALPLATVWVRLPVTVILPTVCCVAEELLCFCSTEALLCVFWAEELVTFAVPEEFATALLLEDGALVDEIPGCTLADEVPGGTIAEETPGCTVADDAIVAFVVEEVCGGIAVAEEESVGGIRLPELPLSGALVASSEQFMNARTDPRTRTDFRNWCFISILIYRNSFLSKAVPIPSTLKDSLIHEKINVNFIR